ncbi:MAG TPA: hypothetical protein VJM49_06365 [Acidimicrobiales bacterium]|nr:hypothetical protein [Acidimicrobiales bacterium]
MDRLLLVAALVIVAVGVAVVLQRRRPRPAPTNAGYRLPDRVDRADFERADAPWLVAVFTSATCATCAGVWDKARLLASDEVVAQQLEVSAEREVHRRYGIDAVPSVVIADVTGEVRATFVGPVTATDLWASLAELRSPGTLPADGCGHGVDDEADRAAG